MPEECIFCKIASGEIPSNKVYEDDTTLAFLDINPRNPGHALVTPKKHTETVMDTRESEAGHLFQVVRKVAQAVGAATDADGISIAQSNGKAAGQAIPHMHFHVIPRFESEGPIGLEGVLPVKQMKKDKLESIAESVKDNIGPVETSPSPSTEEREEKSGKKKSKKNLPSVEDLDMDF